MVDHKSDDMETLQPRSEKRLVLTSSKVSDERNGEMNKLVGGVGFKSRREFETVSNLNLDS